MTDRTTRLSSRRKSSRCNPDGNCVEVGRAMDDTIGVRDTKAPFTASPLEFSPSDWRTVLTELRTR
ncbi:DUF397 domain-containing protein [Spirillospora sp. NPDC049652]